MSEVGHEDLWLLLALGTTSVLAARAIPLQLQAVSHAVSARPPKASPPMVNKHTENGQAIKAETLAQLASSPNLAVRDAAIHILIDRFLASDTAWEHLCSNLQGQNSVRRTKSLSLIRFILPERPFPQDLSLRWWQPPFLRCLVQCLRNLLPSVIASANDSSFPEQAQMYALEIVDQMLDPATQTSIELFIEAGLISDWLQYFPFHRYAPFDLMTNASLTETVEKFMSATNHPAWVPTNLRALLLSLEQHPTGRTHLKKTHLIESLNESYGNYESHARLSGRSQEEITRRRQRREAIVIGDEGRPIERRDIIQQGQEVSDMENLDLLFSDQFFEGAWSQRSEGTPAEPTNFSRWMQRSLPMR